MKQDDIRIYVDNEMYTCIRDDVHKWTNAKTITVPSPRKTMSFGYDPKPQIMSDMITVHQKECIKTRGKIKKRSMKFTTHLISSTNLWENKK